MGRKLLLINILMLAVIAVLSQQLVALWADFQETPSQLPAVDQRGVDIENPQPLHKVAPISRYLVIGERNLFSAERTAEAVLPEEEEQAPELVQDPQLISVFSMGGEKEAVLTVFEGRRGRNSSQRNVKVGDDVEGYTVSRIEDTYLVLGWKEEEIVINLAPPSGQPAAPQQAARQAVNVITIGSSGPAVETTTLAAAAEEARGLEVSSVGGQQGVRGMGGMPGQGGALQQGMGRGTSMGMGMTGSQGRFGAGSMGRGMTGQSMMGGAGGMMGRTTNRRPYNY